MLDNLLEQFKATYRPGENICIDESLVPWKGRLSFKQFNRNKRARFNIMLFECSESKTGYVYNIKVYVGKENEDECYKLTYSQVQELKGIFCSIKKTINFLNKR